MKISQTISYDFYNSLIQRTLLENRNLTNESQEFLCLAFLMLLDAIYIIFNNFCCRQDKKQCTRQVKVNCLIHINFWKNDLKKTSICLVKYSIKYMKLCTFYKNLFCLSQAFNDYINLIYYIIGFLFLYHAFICYILTRLLKL